MTYAAFRNTLYAGLVHQGARSEHAQCTADRIMREPSIAPLLAHPDQEPTSDQLDGLRAQLTTIAAACARSQGS